MVPCLRMYAKGALAVWTLVAALLLLWHFRGGAREMNLLARAEARASWRKAVACRSRTARHGGVQGAKPVNPANAPDPWEAAALSAFEKGETEVSAVEPLGGRPHMRFIRPLYAEEGCLKCHAAQGYKAGDVSGVLGVAVPMEPFDALRRSLLLQDLLVIGLLWIGGCAFVLIGCRRTEGYVARIEESEKRYRFIYNSTPTMLHSIDREGRLVSVSDYWLAHMGYSRGEVIGRKSVEFLTDESARYARDAVLPEFMRTGVCKDVPYRMVKKDGGAIDVLLSATAEKDAGGRVVRSMAVIEDVTERKRAEEERGKLQAQLQQAMKMEAVGRLAGGVAHDFNNLLTVIAGCLSLALMKLSPSAPASALIEEAKMAAERATVLTRQLLAYSRKQIVEPKILNLNDLIGGLGKMLVRLIGENIELTIVPGDGLGAVEIDPGQLEQILVNLAVNARDAMPDGGKLVIETSQADLDEVFCSRHPCVKPGKFVLLVVSDTGCGMSEEVKANLFEPFFTTKTKETGTGLGLSMTYGAVEQAGGSIDVYSEMGKGSTFKIYLPEIEEEAPMRMPCDSPQDPSRGSETVLLVEDEETVRKLCTRFLERLGYQVMPAADGIEAIALARGRADRIDLLMTDVVMPGMNGRELSKQVLPIHPEMKVLFTSGYTEDAIVHYGVLDDGISFIGKPYSLSALAKKIRDVLGTPEA